MSADVQSAPEIKSLDRVASIPLVHDSLSAIQHTLSTYTPTAYAYGAAIGNSAYSMSAPIQARLAPLIVSADGYALKGLDVAQAKFPTAFSIKPEEVIEGIRHRRDSAVGVVTRPVYGIANGVDSSLAPIVDRLEIALQKLGPTHAAEDSSSSASSSDSASSASSSNADTTQVARLYHLSLDLRNQIYNLSTEQVKLLQSQNAYIQVATEKVHNLNTSLTTSYATAKDKSLEFVQDTRTQAQAYTASILNELEKIQGITRDLPKQVQARLQPVQEGIQSSLSELSEIMKSDIPLGDKVSKVGTAVQERVQPLLAQTTHTIQAAIDQAKNLVVGTKAKVAEEAKETREEATAQNGDADHS